MIVTIYLDAIFILNLLFNYLILLLVQSLLRHETNNWRVIFGSFIATLIVPLTIFFPKSILTTMIGKTFYSLIIILSSFKFVSIKQFLKLLLSFYFISFGIGGGLIAVHFMINNSFELSSSGIVTYRTGLGDMVSWVFVIIGFPIVWLFTKWRMDRHLVDEIRYNEIYTVLIDINGVTFKTNGFIDSGNQLIDPITRTPVIICDESFLKQYFLKEEWKLLKIAYDQLDIDIVPVNWRNRIFIVPFKGVEGSGNILFTIRADSLTIKYNEQKLITNKVLVGVQFSQLTEDCSYHCLLHPKIIQTAISKPA